MISLVFGSTGATGRETVKELCKNRESQKVYTLSRRNINYETSKPDIIESIIFTSINEPFSIPDTVHCAFYCFGSTRKGAGSAEKFAQVELEAAHNFLEHLPPSCKHVGLVSSIGADANSFWLYPRTKGEVENLFYEKTLINNVNLYIYRPGLIECDREEKRIGEEIMKWFTPIGNWLFSNKFSISSIDIARAMVKDALISLNSKEVLYVIRDNKDIHQSLMGEE